MQNAQPWGATRFDARVPIVEKSAPSRVAEIMNLMAEFVDDRLPQCWVRAAIFNNNNLRRPLTMLSDCASDCLIDVGLSIVNRNRNCDLLTPELGHVGTLNVHRTADVALPILG